MAFVLGIGAVIVLNEVVDTVCQGLGSVCAKVENGYGDLKQKVKKVFRVKKNTRFQPRH